MKAITREQMKLAEGTTINKYRVPSLILMENAGTKVAEVAVDYLRELGKDPANCKVVVLCGAGNNGGDGAVAARHIHNLGTRVTVVLTRDLHKIFSDMVDADALGTHVGGMGEDTTINLKILKHMSLDVQVVLENDFFHRFFAGCDLIVDALLGTGLNTGLGKIKSPTKDLIEAVNELDIPVVCVDTPSGLDCNTGDLVGLAVQANKTVTFALPKKGFFLSMGPTICGEVIVSPISIPREVLESLKEE